VSEPVVKAIIGEIRLLCGPRPWRRHAEAARRDRGTRLRGQVRQALGWDRPIRPVRRPRTRSLLAANALSVVEHRDRAPWWERMPRTGRTRGRRWGKPLPAL